MRVRTTVAAGVLAATASFPLAGVALAQDKDCSGSGVSGSGVSSSGLSSSGAAANMEVSADISGSRNANAATCQGHRAHQADQHKDGGYWAGEHRTGGYWADQHQADQHQADQHQADQHQADQHQTGGDCTDNGRRCAGGHGTEEAAGVDQHQSDGYCTDDSKRCAGEHRADQAAGQAEGRGVDWRGAGGYEAEGHGVDWRGAGGYEAEGHGAGGHDEADRPQTEAHGASGHQGSVSRDTDSAMAPTGGVEAGAGGTAGAPVELLLPVSLAGGAALVGGGVVLARRRLTGQAD